jgi:hypothetical protein
MTVCVVRSFVIVFKVTFHWCCFDNFDSEYLIPYLGEFPLCQANQDASPSIYSNWRTANHLNFENIVVQKNKKKNPKTGNYIILNY